MCEPPSATGTRMQANARRDDMALGAFGARLRAILETPMPMDPDTRELQPRTLGLAPDANALLADFADATEAVQAPGCDLVHITGTASKAAEQAARIAGVLTLWRDLDAHQVQPSDMVDAITLTQFYLSEASRHDVSVGGRPLNWTGRVVSCLWMNGGGLPHGNGTGRTGGAGVRQVSVGNDCETNS